MTTKTLRTIIFGFLGLILLGAFCAWLFKKELTQVGEWFIGNYGLWGIGFGTLITDSSPIPLTSEPFAILALASGVPVWKLIIVMSIASHLGAPLGYTGGYVLGKQAWFQRIIERRFPSWQEKGVDHAVKVVAIGALFPVPYALTTWFAGSVQADFKRVLLVASFRWIKTAITLALLAGGWFWGTSV